MLLLLLLLLLPILPLVAGEPQQGHILLEDQHRPEEVAGCGEHLLHGSGAWEEGVVLDEQVYPLFPIYAPRGRGPRRGLPAGASSPGCWPLAPGPHYEVCRLAPA